MASGVSGRVAVGVTVGSILVVAGLFVWQNVRATQRSMGAASRPASAPAEAAVAVVYTSMDEPTAAEVFRRAAAVTGVRIIPQFDVEASKTTGLVNKIRGERAVPQADVFWSNEPFQTEQLGREGLLEAYNSPAAADLPAGVVPAHRLWTPMTLKPRVVAVGPKAAQRPAGGWTEAVVAPAVRGRVAISNPQFGTCRGQFAALAQRLGQPAYQAWLDQVAANQVRICDGNSVAVQLVVRGEVDFAWTDLDDILTARLNGQAVDLVIPPGPPFLTPATVALVKGGPNPAAGRKVFDFLVSAEAEDLMARSEMRLTPIRAALRERLFAVQPPLWPTEVHAVDWTAFPDVPAVLDAMAPALEAAKRTLLK